ncbi:MAG: Mov34/MPN/PAD-1 family protein [Cyanobacteria bacterium P01_H01_bin.105]
MATNPVSNLLSVEIKQKIAEHARLNPEREICGVVVMDEIDDSVQVIPLPNTHPTPETDFRLPANTIPKYGDRLQAIYHSHWEESSPALLTPADVINARATGVASIVYHTTFDQWDLFDPNGLHPWPLKQKHLAPKQLKFYLGWPWEWGRSDCLTYFEPTTRECWALPFKIFNG